MILVDHAIWPAHGTVWAHLVSDTSLEELHEFARAMGIPPKGFDLDHYDVPESRIADLVAAGAVQVTPRELLARLVASGLRVRGLHREVEGLRRRDADLRHRWGALEPHVLAGASGQPARRHGWHDLGSDLLTRWSQPHRQYHDAAHLHDVLLSLDTLAHAGEQVQTQVLLAAWFHDAVYDGRPGDDEGASARLAETSLSDAGAADRLTAETARLVRVTVNHVVDPDDHAAACLVDADLSILASTPKRYGAYAEAVRREYAHVPDEMFRLGRASVLERLLGHDRLYRTPTGHARWERPARANLERELRHLRLTP